MPASIDLAVDLARADARGIHMSRLYLQLQDGLAREAIASGRALERLNAYVALSRELAGAQG